MVDRRRFIRLMGSAAAAAALSRTGLGAAPGDKQGKSPNIIFILADDLGYGDVGCYGATRVKTPNMDKLASQGVRFTDAHSSSATCTPTRYSLLTGEYAWRKKGTGILPGDASLIIEPGRTTLPSVMKQAGYTTGCVGKWHLGLGSGNVNWNGEITPGPLEVGFDYCFIIPATGDRVPCVYVEDHRVAGLDPKDPITVSYSQPVGNDPTGRQNPELLKMKLSQGHDQTIVNGISRIGYMSGGKAARWVDEDMADTITRKAVQFIERSKDKPFFLYFATHDIHVPRVPHQRFKSGSQCGVRGDVVQEFDWSVGEIVSALDRLGLAENTLLIVTSDNGPVVNDGYDDGATEDLKDHTPAGPLRGGKYSFYEGGTREPFIVRWPERVKPGVSDALIGQWDLLASFAALTGQTLATEAGPDSFNILPALLGDSKQGRDHLVEHANRLAIRKGQWKLVSAGGAAPAKAAAKAKAKAGAKAASAGPELYDLAADIGEKNNVAAQNPEVVKELTALLDQIREKGRSRP